MRRTKFLQLIGLLLPLAFISCTAKTCESKKGVEPVVNQEKFSFAFLTDVHLNKQNRGESNDGLRQALEDTKHRNVSFIMFGGDNVETDRMKKEDADAAEEVHKRFKQIVDESGQQCHFTIGNHDRYYYSDGQVDSLGYRLFEKYFGPTYGSFDYQGVHFITLNSLDHDADKNYSIGAAQMEWLKTDLEKTGKLTPIVVTLHVPMLSLYYPVVEGTFKGTDMISNSQSVLNLLKEYNTKLVLQGHQHLYEEINERQCWFITGGAVCAYWWGGPFLETQEGYLLVHVDQNNEFSWEYVDYGWTAKTNK